MKRYLVLSGLQFERARPPFPELEQKMILVAPPPAGSDRGFSCPSGPKFAGAKSELRGIYRYANLMLTGERRHQAPSKRSRWRCASRIGLTVMLSIFDLLLFYSEVRTELSLRDLHGRRNLNAGDLQRASPFQAVGKGRLAFADCIECYPNVLF